MSWGAIAVTLRFTCFVIAKFHRTRISEKLRWSVRVSDKVRAGPFGSAPVRAGPVGSGRARVVEFSYNPAVADWSAYLDVYTS